MTEQLLFHRMNVHPSQTAEPRECNALAKHVPTQKIYFVYIMTNRSKTLYVGVTNSLIRRVREHKSGMGSMFTKKYKLDRLVYYERYEDVHRAIGREKQIKGWLRIKKIALIVSINPAWRDLSLEWYGHHPFEPDASIAKQALPLSS
jgi:putative endonuclease